MIDTLLSSVLNDSKISHEEFTNIVAEKNINENINKNIKDKAELSSLERTAESRFLERIKEEEKSVSEPSSLERTTL